MTDDPPLLWAWPEQEGWSEPLARALGADRQLLSLHRFPDGETKVSLPADPAGRTVALLCSLDRPDGKTLPLLFAADAARELGARRVGLVAPYLAYMRQDRRFHAGEAISSRSYARLLSESFDFLLTVEPHLHRYRDLADIYRCPARALSAAPAIAAWLEREVARPLLIGPDAESAAWTGAVAERLQAPYIVLEKTRQGDREVSVSPLDAGPWRDRTPVLLDDILSSGRTMLAAVQRLREAGLAAPVCVAVHALCGDEVAPELEAAGAALVASCNGISHSTNRIDLVPTLAEALQPWCVDAGED